MTRLADARRSVAMTVAPCSFPTPRTIAVFPEIFDVGAEALQFQGMHEPVLENGLGNHGVPSAIASSAISCACMSVETPDKERSGR